MNDIRYSFDFIIDEKNQLLLTVEVKWKQETVPLALASLMSFLYQNESSLSEEDLEFCYSLARFVKKIESGNSYIFAIPDDQDMGLFFNKALELDRAVFWKRNGRYQKLQHDELVPVTILVKQHKSLLVCEMVNRDEWLKNIFSFMIFNTSREKLYFCNGTIIKNISNELEVFINQLMDKNKITFDSTEAEYFIKNIYEPNKKKVYWQIKADFSEILPQSIDPAPCLTLTFSDNILSPALSFKYASIIIFPDNKESIISDKKNDKRYLRDMEMEVIYQQDLMDLFTENDLPFMLQNPRDIAEFMKKVVPVLIERGWFIDSNVPEFNIIKESADIDFTIQSSGQDWFYFEPNCNINGQKISLQEIARLMIQDQGYIKTKSGYVQISEKSQKELKLLSKFNAFGVNRKFSKMDILPMISASSIQGGNDQSRKLIDSIKNIDSFSSHKLPGSDFNGELRLYQQHGVNWINFLYSTGFGGVLADDMGLGKTVQVLAFSTFIKEKHPKFIICPTNVVYNWEREITKFLPGKKIINYTGSNRCSRIEELEHTDFIISSFGIIKNDLEFLAKIKFSAIFVDEAQYMKNFQTQISRAIKLLDSRFKLAVTGTPVENHLFDIWNLFDFVMPGYLGEKKVFDIAVKDGHREIIKTKLKPFVMRRIKAEVLDSLPAKTEIIIKCNLNENQELLYKTVLDAAKKGIKNAKGQREYLNILTSLLKLRQVCIHPRLLNEFKHQKDMESAKFEEAKKRIIELIDEGNKAVIFTQFTGMLDILEDWAQENSIYLERIDGSVTGKKRIASIERFQSSKEAGLFIISLKAGGVGINLTAADYVLHLDPWWNPAVESQATDRVHRIGQKNKVIVYKFISKGTIEEKILELQEQKRELISSIIDIEADGVKKLDIEELKSLLI
ncbi:MAG: hypothetical protein GY730_02165 [bacterium]|nr:hypothetical protein [bacterium]